jgi:hypothetical protein
LAGFFVVLRLSVFLLFQEVETSHDNQYKIAVNNTFLCFSALFVVKKTAQLLGASSYYEVNLPVQAPIQSKVVNLLVSKPLGS